MRDCLGFAMAVHSRHIAFEGRIAFDALDSEGCNGWIGCGRGHPAAQFPTLVSHIVARSGFGLTHMLQYKVIWQSGVNCWFTDQMAYTMD